MSSEPVPPPDSGRDRAHVEHAVPPLESFLTYRLHRVNKLTDRDSTRAYWQDCELPLSEGRALAAVGRFEPLSVKDLALAANLDKAQASRSAQALVTRGLLSKQVSSADGRGVVLQLTTEGRRRYQAVMHMIQRRNDEIFGVLSPADQALLGQLLDRVAAGLRDSAGAD